MHISTVALGLTLALGLTVALPSFAQVDASAAPTASYVTDRPVADARDRLVTVFGAIAREGFDVHWMGDSARQRARLCGLRQKRDQALARAALESPCDLLFDVDAGGSTTKLVATSRASQQPASQGQFPVLWQQVLSRSCSATRATRVFCSNQLRPSAA